MENHALTGLAGTEAGRSSSDAHSPGPWWFDQDWHRLPTIFDANGNKVAVVEKTIIVDGRPKELPGRAANARLIVAASFALDFAQFYDTFMTEQFPSGLQPAYDSGLLHPSAAEAWGRCRTFICMATGARP